jgi:hypothetical protein
VPLLEAALDADPEVERERAVLDVIAIARDRARTGAASPALTTEEDR